MIIHSPQTITRGDTFRISARLEFQQPLPDGPDRLWFELPASQAEYVDGRLESFVMSLLPLAMKRGEPIEVRGPLSPRLAYGLRNYQNVFHLWFPNRFTPADIACEEYAPAPPAPDTAGVAFSGGADSFYTLWQHLPEREPLPGYQVTHALFVHGFDITLDDAKTFEVARAAYDRMTADLGLTLISLRTNVRALLRDVDWHLAYGAALAGAAQLVGRAFSRFYVPAGHTYRDNYPTGADDRIALLSTEALGLFYSGAEATRVEKLVTLAGWPETYARLRVCWEHPDGLTNCCRCEKCVRTMIPLSLENRLTAYTTFPHPIERRHIRALRFKEVHTRIYARQLIAHARRRGRTDIARDLYLALACSYAAGSMRAARRRLCPLRRALSR